MEAIGVETILAAVRDELGYVLSSPTRCGTVLIRVRDGQLLGEIETMTRRPAVKRRPFIPASVTQPAQPVRAAA